MSCRLLQMLGNPDKSLTPPKFVYKASDDLESLFYIFLEITTGYEGFGKKSVEGEPPTNATLWRQTYAVMNQPGLSVSGSLKRLFLMGEESYSPTPFFKDCYPILEAWRKEINDAMTMKGTSLTKKSARS